MIITTKNNEFIQSWLTFLEDNDQEIESYDFLYDKKRELIDANKTVIKLKKKGIFSDRSVKTNYFSLLKSVKLKPKYGINLEIIKKNENKKSYTGNVFKRK